MKKLSCLFSVLLFGLFTTVFISCSDDDEDGGGDRTMEAMLVGNWKPISYEFAEQTFSEKEKAHRLEFKPVDSSNMGACYYYQNNSFVQNRYAEDMSQGWKIEYKVLEDDFESKWGITTYEEEGFSLLFLEKPFYVLTPTSYYVEKLNDKELVLRHTTTNLIHKFERIK